MDKYNHIQEKWWEKAPQSYWIASTPRTSYPVIEEDIRVDVAIVGGGMVGITAAYLLKREGLKVAIIEADHIIQGTTGHTTAKVTSQHNLIYYKIKKHMGEEKARQYAEANESAIDMIAALIKEKNIDCDFARESAYVYTLRDGYVKNIADEADIASSLGIKASYLDSIPLPLSVKAAVRFDNQARFHPRKYLLTLAEEIPGDGSYIFERTKAINIEEGNPCAVITEQNKKVTAPNVIIASHYPFYDWRGLYFSRVFPERSYALGVKINGKYPGGMYITAEDPGRSLRTQEEEDGELIIVSGEHHRTGQGEDTVNHYENLREFVNEVFDVQEIRYHWSTQDGKTLDDVPYVGRLTSNRPYLYVATGFRKWGMTNSTASAMILKDLIVKGESPWAPVYDPSRTVTMTAVKNFIFENADVAEKLISGKLASAPEDEEIKPGEGKVVEIEGHKVGAYKDEKGQVHLVDTTCTHLGCELKWNAAEKTWDCPCHGSRFTYEGDIVEGPTLKSIKLEIQKES